MQVLFAIASLLVLQVGLSLYCFRLKNAHPSGSKYQWARIKP